MARAAEMFDRCQDYEQSAALYEKAGDMGQAARMFGEAGDYYRAAVAAKKAGMVDQAIVHLQKVRPDSSEYPASLVELAEHLMERGLPGVAVQKLRKALGDQPLYSGNMDVYYALAEASQEMGDIDEACEILRSIVAGGLRLSGRGWKTSRVGKESVTRSKGGPRVLGYGSANRDRWRGSLRIRRETGCGRNGYRLSCARSPPRSGGGLQDVDGTVHGGRGDP